MSQFHINPLRLAGTSILTMYRPHTDFPLGLYSLNNIIQQFISCFCYIKNGQSSKGDLKYTRGMCAGSPYTLLYLI